MGAKDTGALAPQLFILIMLTAETLENLEEN